MSLILMSPPPTKWWSSEAKLAFSGNSLVPEVGAVQTNNGVTLDSVLKRPGFNSSLKFNGSSHFIISSGDWPASGSTDFTLEMWYYTTNIATRQWIILTGSGWGLGLDVGNKGSGPRLGIWAGNNSWVINSDPGGNGIGSTTLQNSRWYHFAYCRSGNKWRSFVDGVKNVELTLDLTVTNQDSYVSFGRHSAGIGLPVIANIQRFQFTHEALYTNNFTPK